MGLISAVRRHRPTAVCRLAMDWWYGSREWTVYVIRTALASPADGTRLGRPDRIRFRRLEPSDVEAVAYLFPAALSPLRRRYVAEKLHRRNEEGVPGFVADEAGRIAGAVWLPTLEPHHVENPVLAKELVMPARRVANLFVVPPARGRGLGTWLLQCAVVWCRQARVGSVLSLVEIGNAASRRVHEQVGFRRVARLGWRSRLGRKGFLTEPLSPAEPAQGSPGGAGPENDS